MYRESLRNILTKDLYHNGELSTRAVNCCLSANLNTLYDIVAYFEERRSFLEIQHAGRITSDELEALCKETLSQFNETPKKTGKGDFVDDYVARHGYKPMFWILEKELTPGVNRDFDIFSNCYPVLNNVPTRTEAELALAHDLSTQRVNQIKNNTYRDIFSVDNPLIREMNHDWGVYANQVRDKDVVWQDDDRVAAIIKEENVNFSPVFILQLLSVLTANTHVIYGGLKRGRKNRRWKKGVLIPKEPALAFNFERLITDVEHLISINLLEMLTDFRSYMLRSPGWQRYEEGIFEEVMGIASSVLQREFGLQILDGKVIIPPSLTSQRQPVETQAQASEAKPSRRGEITPRVSEAKLQVDKAKPRAMAVDKPRDKAGTKLHASETKPRGIRGTVVDFLDKYDTPQTIEAITAHVSRYFPGKSKEDIATTMYSDSKKRFTRYGKGLFGLSDKDYTADSTGTVPTVPRKTFEERLADLEKFLSRNWHFPFSISADPDESSLYRWWRLQRINIDQLSEVQKGEIERIEKLYAGLESEKKAHEWDSRYNALVVFIIDHQRVPSPNSTGLEKLLHEWYKKATRDYNSHRVSDEQARKYRSIEKIINRYTLV
jgi:hypothetical protein